MVWKLTNNQSNESKKIVWEVAPYLRGRGLDIGAGDFKVLPHAISVDNQHHQKHGWTIKPDVLADGRDLGLFASQSMDFVYSSHTLEHIPEHGVALKEWWRVLKPGGYLVLYLPHKEFYPNIGTEGANEDHVHDFAPADIVEMLPDGHDVVEWQERNNDEEYSFLLVVKRIHGKERRNSSALAVPGKTACVVRYGAYGDMIQASSVWSGLKKEGYHVTVFANPPGSDILTNDPNIDKLLVFEKDQVPNSDLGPFWDWQRKKFDKWVNLSESVEGTLLALPGRMIHTYPPALRHSLTNRNYVEFQHEVAEIPYHFDSRFYPSEEDVKWAKKERGKLSKGKMIMWSLAGSSVHKTWAGLDNVLACILLEFNNANVVLVGGPECKMLEAGWENEPRVVKKCGEWTMRQTLSFMRECDLVIGPETGVLNAAALEPMAKVCLLSHSSHENLTRDWVNTTPVWSANTECPGRGKNEVSACHQMHYGFQFCKRDEESGVAQCQKDISVDQVWQAVLASLQ